MMRQEIDQDIELDKMDDTSGDENPYRELIVNNAAKIETTLSQMEQWSILSNVINYVQYDKHPKNFHNISVKPVNKVRNKAKSKQNEKERPISEVEFKNTSDRLKEEYLDWMVLNDRYYWILELANHSCPNHTICAANHLICYLNLLQRPTGSK